jgi:hypothetical protein
MLRTNTARVATGGSWRRSSLEILAAILIALPAVVAGAGTSVLPWAVAAFAQHWWPALAIGALYTLPGFALLGLLWPREIMLTPAARLALAMPVSAALPPVLLLLAETVGLPWGSVATWLLLIACLVFLAGRRYTAWSRQRSASTIHGTHTTPTDLRHGFGVLVALFIGALLVRLYIIRELPTGLLGDSYHHTMMAQLLVDNSGLFRSWQPYAPLETFTYHFGFHANAAFVHWLTGIPLTTSVLWTGQVMNALAVQAAFALAVIALRGSAWTGVLAALVTGFVLTIPAHYVVWGRYTQLTGQVVLVAVVVCWARLADLRLFNLRLFDLRLTIDDLRFVLRKPKPSFNTQQSSIVNRQSSIVNRQSSIVNRQSSIVNRQSSIVNRQSSIVNRQSAIVNRQSSIVNRQSAIVNRQSSIVNRQSAIGNRKIGNRKRFPWRLIILTALLTVAMLLTHYLVTVFAALFVGSYMLALALVRARWQLVGWLVLVGTLAGSLALLLAAPWLLNLASGYLVRNAAAFTSGTVEPARVAAYSALPQSTPLYAKSYVLLAAFAGLLTALWRRNWRMALPGVWCVLLVLCVTPQVLGLPGAGAIDNLTALSALYLPLAPLAGYALASLGALVNRLPFVATQRIESSEQPPADTFAMAAGRFVAVVTALLVVVAWGSAWQTQLIDGSTQLVVPADMQAMEWLRQNTPPDTLILVNGFPAYGGTLVAGSDAGWWIPLLAGRPTTLPPLTYGSERGPSPEYGWQSGQFYQQLRGRTLSDGRPIQVDITSEAALAVLRGAGVTHVYSGASASPGPQSADRIDTALVRASPAFRLVYEHGGVQIYEVVDS